MIAIAEIQRAIMSLPKADCVRLSRWIDEYDWQRWDRQIEVDSEEGRLDFLATEAARRENHLEHL